MFTALTQVVMLVTGILLAPAAIATPAFQDLADLRTVIQSAADTIGSLQNPNRGWGFGSSSSQMGTADLINNITSTLLHSKFQIDTNRILTLFQTAWLNITEARVSPALNASALPPETPTLPVSSSMALSSVIPTSTPSLGNVTTDLSGPYIDCISAIPNLSTSLTSLGRAWHREMNSPVSEAIDILQESITTLQNTMLQHDLLGSSAVLRTVRASSSLESAQQAWSRFLNLPGSTGSGDSGDETQAPHDKRSVRPSSPTNGRYYTHRELWGPKESSPIGGPSQHDGVVEWEKQDESRHGEAQAFEA
ncbi:hypothetical protein SVAN01_01990 [Stagonosporopsis vannaccii]|nr:hypothetical protein SVAN01_01990 [Stagonosporopsis vannaccii]